MTYEFADVEWLAGFWVCHAGAKMRYAIASHEHTFWWKSIDVSERYNAHQTDNSDVNLCNPFQPHVKALSILAHINFPAAIALDRVEVGGVQFRHHWRYRFH